MSVYALNYRDQLKAIQLRGVAPAELNTCYAEESPSDTLGNLIDSYGKMVSISALDIDRHSAVRQKGIVSTSDDCKK